MLLPSIKLKINSIIKHCQFFMVVHYLCNPSILPTLNTDHPLKYLRVTRMQNFSVCIDNYGSDSCDPSAILGVGTGPASRFESFFCGEKGKQGQFESRVLLPPRTTPAIINRLPCFIGAQFGTVISMPLSGLLSVSAGGWPSIFYVFGAIGALWCVAFLYWVREDPESDSRMNPEERKYIQDALGAKIGLPVSGGCSLSKKGY